MAGRYPYSQRGLRSKNNFVYIDSHVTEEVIWCLHIYWTWNKFSIPSSHQKPGPSDVKAQIPIKVDEPATWKTKATAHLIIPYGFLCKYGSSSTTSSLTYLHTENKSAPVSPLEKTKHFEMGSRAEVHEETLLTKI